MSCMNSGNVGAHNAVNSPVFGNTTLAMDTFARTDPTAVTERQQISRNLATGETT
jgi:hypothetical protein